MAARYGQFLDDWVENNTIFAFVSQGGCACCSLSVSSEVADMIRSISDVETDGALGAEAVSPWPQFLREEVWGDRVRFRKRLKEGSARYAAVLDGIGDDELGAFWDALALPARRRLFQAPIKELHRALGEDYGLSESYRVVLVNVARQVENFGQTLYDDATPSDTERRFQEALSARRGAFVVDEAYMTGRADEPDGFIARLREQTSPKLLLRAAAGAGGDDNGGDDNDDGDGDGDDGDEQRNKRVGNPGVRVAQSFKADRRLVRLVVFRQFVDAVLAAFRKHRAAA